MSTVPPPPNVPAPAPTPTAVGDGHEKCQSCGVGPLLFDERRTGLCDQCGAYKSVHGALPDAEG